MKGLVTILAIFCLSTSALAQSAPGTTNGLTHWRADVNVYDWNRQGAPIPNANQCAPGYARPVWGPNSALLGYSCSNYANGS